MQTINETFLSLGVDDAGDIGENQLLLLGIEADKKEQWYERVLGSKISDARAELFVLLKGIVAKKDQERVISNYKALQRFREAKRCEDETLPTPSSTPKKEAAIAPVKGDVIIYCDGGCSPNPGQSGSGIAVYRGGAVSELWYGLYEKKGTNNTAELNALYHSLLLSEKECALGNRVEIKCDSMYSINCIQTWAISWEKNGWSKKGGEIKNLEIIQKSYHLYNQLKSKVELSHIKAHAGLEGNELADRMTVHAREQKNSAFVQYEEEIDIALILSMRAG
jgi:ribonuclease HI